MSYSPPHYMRARLMLQGLSPRFGVIEDREFLSRTEFLVHHYSIGAPVVLTGAASHWTAADPCEEGTGALDELTETEGWSTHPVPAAALGVWSTTTRNKLVVPVDGTLELELLSPEQHQFVTASALGQDADSPAIDIARPSHVSLRPGDALFLPTGWWWSTVRVAEHTKIVMTTRFVFPNPAIQDTTPEGVGPLPPLEQLVDSPVWLGLGSREGILFVERTQSTLRLNPTAAYIACGIMEGLPRESISKGLVDMFGVGPEVADQDIRQLAVALEGCARLETPAPPERRAVADELKAAAGEVTCSAIRLLGHRVGIEGPAEVLSAALSSVEHLAAPADSTRSDALIELFTIGRRILIARDGEVVGECRDERELGPMIRDAVILAVCGVVSPPCVVRATTVGPPDRCVLVLDRTGGLGSGLCGHLVSAGFACGCDGVAIIDGPDLALRPLPVGVEVDEHYWDDGNDAGGVFEGLAEHRRWTGRRVKYVLPGSMPASDPWPVAAVVVPTWSTTGEGSLTETDAIEALARLELATRETDGKPVECATIEALFSAMGRVPCYELRVAGVDAAVESLRNLPAQLSASTTTA